MTVGISPMTTMLAGSAQAALAAAAGLPAHSPRGGGVAFGASISSRRGASQSQSGSLPQHPSHPHPSHPPLAHSNNRGGGPHFVADAFDSLPPTPRRLQPLASASSVLFADGSSSANDHAAAAAMGSNSSNANTAASSVHRQGGGSIGQGGLAGLVLTTPRRGCGGSGSIAGRGGGAGRLGLRGRSEGLAASFSPTSSSNMGSHIPAAKKAVNNSAPSLFPLSPSAANAKERTPIAASAAKVATPTAASREGAAQQPQTAAKTNASPTSKKAPPPKEAPQQQQRVIHLPVHTVVSATMVIPTGMALDGSHLPLLQRLGAFGAAADAFSPPSAAAGTPASLASPSNIGGYGNAHGTAQNQKAAAGAAAAVNKTLEGSSRLTPRSVAGGNLPPLTPKSRQNPASCGPPSASSASSQQQQRSPNRRLQDGLPISNGGGAAHPHLPHRYKISTVGGSPYGLGGGGGGGGGNAAATAYSTNTATTTTTHSSANATPHAHSGAAASGSYPPRHPHHAALASSLSPNATGAKGGASPATTPHGLLFPRLASSSSASKRSGTAAVGHIAASNTQQQQQQQHPFAVNRSRGIVGGGLPMVSITTGGGGGDLSACESSEFSATQHHQMLPQMHESSEHPAAAALGAVQPAFFSPFLSPTSMTAASATYGAALPFAATTASAAPAAASDLVSPTLAMPLPIADLSSTTTTMTTTTTVPLIRICHLPLTDMCDSDIFLRQQREAFAFIERCRAEGRKVVVFCREAKSRSPSTVIAYLMRRYGWSFSKSIKHVRARCTTADPNIRFCIFLTRLQQTIEDERRAANAASGGLGLVGSLGLSGGGVSEDGGQRRGGAGGRREKASPSVSAGPHAAPKLRRVGRSKSNSSPAVSASAAGFAAPTSRRGGKLLIAPQYSLPAPSDESPTADAHRLKSRGMGSSSFTPPGGVGFGPSGVGVALQRFHPLPSSTDDLQQHSANSYGRGGSVMSASANSGGPYGPSSLSPPYAGGFAAPTLTLPSRAVTGWGGQTAAGHAGARINLQCTARSPPLSVHGSPALSLPSQPLGYAAAPCVSPSKPPFTLHASPPQIAGRGRGVPVGLGLRIATYNPSVSANDASHDDASHGGGGDFGARSPWWGGSDNSNAFDNASQKQQRQKQRARLFGNSLIDADGGQHSVHSPTGGDGYTFPRRSDGGLLHASAANTTEDQPSFTGAVGITADGLALPAAVTSSAPASALHLNVPYHNSPPQHSGDGGGYGYDGCFAPITAPTTTTSTSAQQIDGGGAATVPTAAASALFPSIVSATAVFGASNSASALGGIGIGTGMTAMAAATMASTAAAGAPILPAFAVPSHHTSSNNGAQQQHQDCLTLDGYESEEEGSSGNRRGSAKPPAATSAVCEKRRSVDSSVSAARLAGIGGSSSSATASATAELLASHTASLALSGHPQLRPTSGASSAALVDVSPAASLSPAYSVSASAATVSSSPALSNAFGAVPAAHGFAAMAVPPSGTQPPPLRPQTAGPAGSNNANLFLAGYQQPPRPVSAGGALPTAVLPFNPNLTAAATKPFDLTSAAVAAFNNLSSAGGSVVGSVPTAAAVVEESFGGYASLSTYTASLPPTPFTTLTPTLPAGVGHSVMHHQQQHLASCVLQGPPSHHLAAPIASRRASSAANMPHQAPHHISMGAAVGLANGPVGGYAPLPQQQPAATPPATGDQLAVVAIPALTSRPLSRRSRSGKGVCSVSDDDDAEVSINDGPSTTSVVSGSNSHSAAAVLYNNVTASASFAGTAPHNEASLSVGAATVSISASGGTAAAALPIVLSHPTLSSGGDLHQYRNQKQQRPSSAAAVGLPYLVPSQLMTHTSAGRPGGGLPAASPSASLSNKAASSASGSPLSKDTQGPNSSHSQGHGLAGPLHVQQQQQWEHSYGGSSLLPPSSSAAATNSSLLAGSASASTLLHQSLLAAGQPPTAFSPPASSATVAVVANGTAAVGLGQPLPPHLPIGGGPFAMAHPQLMGSSSQLPTADSQGVPPQQPTTLSVELLSHPQQQQSNTAERRQEEEQRQQHCVFPLSTYSAAQTPHRHTHSTASETEAYGTDDCDSTANGSAVRSGNASSHGHGHGHGNGGLTLVASAALPARAARQTISDVESKTLSPTVSAAAYPHRPTITLSHPQAIHQRQRQQQQQQQQQRQQQSGLPTSSVLSAPQPFSYAVAASSSFASSNNEAEAEGGAPPLPLSRSRVAPATNRFAASADDDRAQQQHQRGGVAPPSTLFGLLSPTTHFLSAAADAPTRPPTTVPPSPFALMSYNGAASTTTCSSNDGGGGSGVGGEGAVVLTVGCLAPTLNFFAPSPSAAPNSSAAVAFAPMNPLLNSSATAGSNGGEAAFASSGVAPNGSATVVFVASRTSHPHTAAASAYSPDGGGSTSGTEAFGTTTGGGPFSPEEGSGAGLLASVPPLPSLRPTMNPNNEAAESDRTNVHSQTALLSHTSAEAVLATPTDGTAAYMCASASASAAATHSALPAEFPPAGSL